MAETNPYPLLLDIEILPPTVNYFVDPVRGRPPVCDFNYTLVEKPEDLPTYSIANVQDFYLTSRAAGVQFIIPMFLNLPDVIFGEFDVYHTVTAADELRIDLISYQFYGTVEYGWIILLANDIDNPFNLSQNTILRIPSTSIVLSNWLTTPVTRQRRFAQ